MLIERRIFLKGMVGVALTAASTLVPPITKAEEKESEPKTLICPIHYWHEIYDKDYFRSYLEQLLEAHFFPVAVRDVINYLQEGVEVWDKDTKPVVMTFDDSLLSQLQAYGVLMEYKARATFYVLTDYADGVHDYLTHQHIKMIADSGLEIGGHGDDMHQSLPSLRINNPVAWERNIVGVKHKLEDITGQEVVSFAYPNGSYDQKTINLVSKHYKGAVRTGGNIPLLDRSKIFELPRLSKS